MKYKEIEMINDMYNHMTENKYTVRKAAKKTGLSSATISRIQCGGMPDLLSYAKICKFLGCSLDKYIKI